MSNEKQIATFGTSQEGSKNAGTWYGQTGQPLPGIQPSETAQAHATRQAAYDAATKKSGG